MKMLCWSNPIYPNSNLNDELLSIFSGCHSHHHRHHSHAAAEHCIIEARGFRNNNGFVNLSATQIWEIHWLHFIWIIDINAATIYRQWNYESHIPEDHHSSTLTNVRAHIRIHKSFKSIINEQKLRRTQNRNSKHFIFHRNLSGTICAIFIVYMYLCVCVCTTCMKYIDKFHLIGISYCAQ